MADISIMQDHTLSMEQARVAAQKVADEMVAEYEMVAEWNGDVLSFKRTGVSGTLALAQHQAHLEITLGFMLKGFASAIEAKVSKNMEKVFATAA